MVVTIARSLAHFFEMFSLFFVLLMIVDFFIKCFAIEIYDAIMNMSCFKRVLNNVDVLFFYHGICLGQLVDLRRYVC